MLTKCSGLMLIETVVNGIFFGDSKKIHVKSFEVYKYFKELLSSPGFIELTASDFEYVRFIMIEWFYQRFPSILFSWITKLNIKVKKCIYLKKN